MRDLSFVCSTMAPYTRYCVIREGPVGGRAGRPHRRVLCQTRSTDRVNAAALRHKITWVEVHNSCGMRGQGNDISRVWGAFGCLQRLARLKLVSRSKTFPTRIGLQPGVGAPNLKQI